MNTKLIMTISSVMLGAIGVLMTFAPDVVLRSLKVDANPTAILLIQVIGGLYFGYAMLNWMTKSSLIGGIYNRPVAMANFTHFLIAGLALVKGLMSNPALPMALWVAGAAYLVFGLLFLYILFRHPISSTTDQ